jgi:hypothetical protein
MSDVTTPAAAPFSPMTGLLIVLIGLAFIVLWLFAGLKMGLTSFFAGFLFLWYWAAVEHLDFKQIPQSLIGALVGLLIAWQSHWLPVHYGTTGLIVALLIIVAAIYIQLMNWVPLAVNRSTMLYLTVLGAPALLDKLDVVETGGAILFGAVFFCGLIKLAFVFLARKAAPKAAVVGE